MDYKTYMKMQTCGPVEKPEHYHIAEKRTIDHFLRGKIFNREINILDVGCAVGLGMTYLKELGLFHEIYGIDLDARKIRVASEKHGLKNLILGDVADFDFLCLPLFDVIYCSHCLEHVYDAEKVIKRMKEITTDDAIFCFVLPYPNPNPSPAHWSTPILGLDIEDDGKTVMGWFKNHGLLPYENQMDNFREPEIWIVAEKG